MEWNNDQVLRLIDLYRQHECLWNPTDPSYKSKLKKLDSWNKIAKELEYDVAEIKKKMDSLLGSFRRERQKQELKTGSGSNEIYKSTWFAFKSMCFLMDKFVAKKTSNTEELQHESDILEEVEAEETRDEPNENNNTNNEEVPISLPKRKSEFRSPKSKKAKGQIQNSRSDEAYMILKNAVAKEQQRDPSAVYGEHIAAKHRIYSAHTKSVVEHLIGNILFNADMGFYDNKISSQSHSSSISNTTPIPSPSPLSDQYSIGSQNPFSPSSQNDFTSTFNPPSSLQVNHHSCDSQSNYSSLPQNNDNLISIASTFSSSQSETRELNRNNQGRGTIIEFINNFSE